MNKDVAERLLDGEEFSGEEAQELMKTLFGPHYWKLTVNIALVYIDRKEYEEARVVLEGLISDEEVV